MATYIDRLISDAEAKETKDADIQFSFAAQGAEDNAAEWGYGDWDNGEHIADVYLEGCDIQPSVIEALDSWLAEKQK